jgi:hypothetical protein
MKLVFHIHNGQAEEFNVPKDVVIIGRGSHCDVVLPFEGFSRQHAKIELTNGEIFVTDLGSTNGVFLEGQRIPSGQPVKMQSFLNLQIGPAHQVEILEDISEPPMVNVSLKEKTNSKMHVNTNHLNRENTNTKTKRMDTALIKKVTKKSLPAASSNQKKINPSVLFSALLIAGLAYYYMRPNEVAPPEVASPSDITAPVVELTETKFLSVAMIESLAKNKSCEGDKAPWCGAAEILTSSLEGVVLEGRSLILYYNLTPFMNEKKHEKFDALTEQKRLEVFMLRKIFSSVILRSFLKQTNIDNFQAIAGVVNGSDLKLKLGIKMKRDLDLSRFDKFALNDIFDRVINLGEMDELSKLASFYERQSFE